MGLEWLVYINTAATILEGFRSLKNKFLPDKGPKADASTQASVRLDALDERVSLIESRNRELDELLERLARQVGDLTAASRILSRRIVVFSVCAGVSALVAVAALVAALLR